MEGMDENKWIAFANILVVLIAAFAVCIPTSYSCFVGFVDCRVWVSRGTR